MLATEKEAREKWCPFARALDGSPGNAAGVGACVAAVNRGVRAQDQQALRCIGSACMAWRWGQDRFRTFILCDDEAATIEPDRPPSVHADWEWCPANTLGEPAGWMEPEAVANARSFGYCGVAGVPAK